jgi:hypothetical protein
VAAAAAAPEARARAAQGGSHEKESDVDRRLQLAGEAVTLAVFSGGESGRAGGWEVGRRGEGV